MTKKIKKYKPSQLGVVLGLIALLVAGVGITKLVGAYSGGSPKVVIENVENFNQEGDTINQQVSEDSMDAGRMIGVAGDTYGTQPMSMEIFATSTGSNTPSTTISSILNNSGKDRKFTKLEFFARGTSNTSQTYNTVILDFATSSNRYTTSTWPIYSSTFVTSTDPVSVVYNFSTTTGWVTPQEAIWKNNEYAQCGTNKSVSSTDGYCLFEWVYIQ